MTLNHLLKKLEQHKRISSEEALDLAKNAPLHDLARLAQSEAHSINNKRAAFLIDRNINYTNICTARCHFCAFYRPHKHRDGYDLSYEVIDQKIQETLDLGGHRILMQGGLHPEHTVESYEALVSHIHQKFPQLHIHAFSPPEIHHVATKEGRSYREVLLKLKSAGLKSMPGGGAEILVDSVREKIMEGKCTADEWLGVMQASHEVGIRSTATMMLGHVETWADRIEHLERLRDLQDQTEGFLSFIPWTFQPDHTAMNPRSKKWSQVHLMGTYEYLRFLALARLYLDNFTHIQVSMLTQGTKVAQMGLYFGADDVGSLLIEENVVRLAGCDQEGWHESKARQIDIGPLPPSAAEILEKKKNEMRQMISEAGLLPYERNTFYDAINPVSFPT